MASRGPMSEETKKKISEALKKAGGAVKNLVTRSGSSQIEKEYGKEGVQLIKDFNGSKDALIKIGSDIDVAKTKIDILKSKIEGASKEGKKKIREDIKKEREALKEIRAKAKVEKEKIKAVKQRARELKRVAKAKAALQKAEVRKQKLAGVKTRLAARKGKTLEMQRKVSDSLRKEKDPEKRQRLQERLDSIGERIDRIGESESYHKEVEDRIADGILKAERMIKDDGKVAQDFNLLYDNCSSEHLAEKNDSPLAPLVSEKKLNLSLLSTTFDEIADQSMAEIQAITESEIDRVVKKIESSYGDVSALAPALFYLYGKVRASIVSGMKKGYEVGKKTVASELKVEVPKTPTKDTQLINFNADNTALAYESELENETKALTAAMIAAGVGATAAGAALRRRLASRSERMIDNISYGIAAESVGRGRQLTIGQNYDTVVALERTEVLDRRTCPMCRALHGKVVRVDDPYASLNLVHTRCRGLWVPLTKGEFDKYTNIPSWVTNNFDTFGGVPLMNNFKQLRRPKL